MLWAAALVVDYTGIYLAGSDWRLPSPRHFAERHGLIVIIALGESIIAVGVGIGDFPVTVPIVVAALLGLAVSLALWWAYFDVVAPVAERVLARRRGGAGAAGARLLHLSALPDGRRDHLPRPRPEEGRAVRRRQRRALAADPLKGTALWALYGGVALYLLAHLAFRLRNVGSINRPRAVAAVVLAFAPLGAQFLPALAALGLLALLLGCLIAFEVVHYAEARAAVRAEAAHH